MSGWMIGLIAYATINVAMIIYMYIRIAKSDEWFDWFWFPVVHKDTNWYMMPRWAQIVCDISTLIIFFPAIIFHFTVIAALLGIIFLILGISEHKHGDNN